jgi:hypothetical protein
MRLSEDRRATASRWIVFAAIIIGMLGLAYGIEQTHANLVSQNNHHEASIRADHTIIAQNNEIHATQAANKEVLVAVANLTYEVATVIKGLPGADKELTSEADGINAKLTALCAAVGADCTP